MRGVHKVYRVHMQDGTTFICRDRIYTYGIRTAYVESACQCGFREDFAATRSDFDVISHTREGAKDFIKVSECYLPIKNISYIEVLIHDWEKQCPTVDWFMAMKRDGMTEKQWEEVCKKHPSIPVAKSPLVSSRKPLVTPEISAPESSLPHTEELCLKRLRLCAGFIGAAAATGFLFFCYIVLHIIL